MELSHLVHLISELTPNSSMNYVRGNNSCTFVKIDKDDNRLYAKTPEGKDISFAKSFLSELAEKIVENRPFNTSQLLNNMGSNRAVVDSIIANTSEIYWLDKDRSRYTVWIPSHPHMAGELVEWKDMDFLSENNHIPLTSNECSANPDEVKKSFISFWKLIDEHGADYDIYASTFQDNVNPLLNAEFGINDVFEITDIIQFRRVISKLIEKYSNLQYLQSGTAPNGNRYLVYSTHKRYIAFLEVLKCTKGITQKHKNYVSSNLTASSYRPYLTAIRTKPFLLLAGISGTGKSRIVREFAFKSCPKYLQDKDGTTPGNYCMIEVKPNWHDSTELLGYYSRLGSKPGYQFTKFVKFLVKAKMFPEVPFFVCLDEMNLAPVEQYFAEILSILETRKVVIGEDGEKTIKTEAIIDAEHFKALGKIGGFAPYFTDRDIYLKLFGIDTESDIDEEVGGRTDLTTEGLTLPDNVVIIGTVNMDDTTHQFSRKVIDRAMTIEMNGGNLRNMFGGSKNLEYLPEAEQKEWQNAFTRRYVTADEVLEAHPDVAEELTEKLPAQLEEINRALKGTPFEVSYRVLNELTIMVGVMLDEGKEPDDAISKSVNNILLMKILPRIEGDAEMFAMSREYKAKVGVSYDTRLEWLKDIAPDIKEPSADAESENDDTEEKAEVLKEHQPTAKEKIQEMIDRLDNQEFTRFWP